MSLWVHPDEFGQSKILALVVQVIDYLPCVRLEDVRFTSIKKVSALVLTTNDKHHAPFNNSDH